MGLNSLSSERCGLLLNRYLGPPGTLPGQGLCVSGLGALFVTSRCLADASPSTGVQSSRGRVSAEPVWPVGARGLLGCGVPVLHSLRRGVARRGGEPPRTAFRSSGDVWFLLAADRSWRPTPPEVAVRRGTRARLSTRVPMSPGRVSAAPVRPVGPHGLLACVVPGLHSLRRGVARQGDEHPPTRVRSSGDVWFWLAADRSWRPTPPEVAVRVGARASLRRGPCPEPASVRGKLHSGVPRSAAHATA